MQFFILKLDSYALHLGWESIGSENVFKWLGGLIIIRDISSKITIRNDGWEPLRVAHTSQVQESKLNTSSIFLFAELAPYNNVWRLNLKRRVRAWNVCEKLWNPPGWAFKVKAALLSDDIW